MAMTDATLVLALDAHVRLVRGTRAGYPNGWQWYCPEHVVTCLGRSYAPQVPGIQRMMEPKRCFWNAIQQALINPKMTYVEGFAMLPDIPLPIHHAWVEDVDAAREALDFTTTGFAHYFGIPFRREVIEAHFDAGFAGISLLDNWEGRWPMLRKTEEEIRNLIAD